MPVFLYKALQADGAMAEGQIEAAGRPEAFRQMEGLKLRPINLTEKAAGKPKTGNDSAAPAGKLSLKFDSKKINARALENFTRLLSSLLAAGVPLSRALVILNKEAGSPAAAAKWKQIYDYVIDGMSLADAMAKSPDTFPRVYVAMVQAGETGGFLDVVLAQIADFQTRERDLRSKVMAAMIYPAVLLALAVCVLTVLLTFFIPKFQGMFNSFGAALPLITQVILAVSHIIRSYGLIVLAVLVVSGIVLRTWVTSEKGRRTWEGLILQLPLVGPLVAQFAMSRFTRMLGTLIGAGVPLVQSLNVARKSIGNQILVDAVSESIGRVQEGGQLGQSLASCRRLFPSSVLEMIAVAEESGKLDVELIRIANVTESDLDRELKIAVSLAEPLMLFCIAALVGTIFIGILLPVFSVQQFIH